MSNLELTLSEQTRKMLESFKKVVNTVIGEEMLFTDYPEISHRQGN